MDQESFLLNEAIIKGGILGVSYKRGRWILRVMDKNIKNTTNYLKHPSDNEKTNSYDIMTEFQNPQDSCTSTGSNHGSYPSVNLKDVLRYLMKPPYKKKHTHIFFLEKYFA